MCCVSCEDTELSELENGVSIREINLRTQYKALATAKAVVEELHDKGDLRTELYFSTTRELSRAMAAVDEIVSELQLREQPKIFEIVRLRITT